MPEILHSNIIGEGRPLLILHGFLGSGDNWISLARRWAKEGFRVHLIDLRNHGKSFWSDRFDFEVLLQDLDNYIAFHRLEKPHLLGHSLGGKILMFDAVKNPENRGKYIIVDIAPKAYTPHHQFIFDALKAVNPAFYRSREDIEKALEPYISQRPVRLFIMKNLKRTPEGFAWKINIPVLEHAMRESGKALPPGTTYDKEILFLRGTKSPYISGTDIDLIRQHFPKAHIMNIHAGHWLHAEKPEAVFQAVKNFLSP